MRTQFHINPLAALCSILSCSIVIFLLLSFRAPIADKTGRLGCLDGLRGFLAMGVFFYHYVTCYYSHLTGRWDIPPSIFYYLSGKVAVSLFFTITGFLFWHKIWTKQGKVDWFNLYISRIFRIVPLYWFSVCIIVSIVFILEGFSFKVPLFSLAKEIITWLSFLWLPDINGFHDTGRIFAYVQWTLVYEWVFYLSLPVLALAIRYSNGKLLIPCLMATGVVLGVVKPLNIPYIDISTKYFVYFLIGALAASFYSNDRLRALAQNKFASVIAASSIVCIFVFFHTPYGLWQDILLAMFFIPVAFGNSMFGLFKLPVFTMLGDISYSIYLLHGIILYLLFTVFIPSFFSQITSLSWIYAGMSLTGIIVVCVSWLTYSLIEKPFMDLGKSFVKR